MNALTYVRLIGFTAGTLLMLFWMVVILGYRRQRNFERVLFFLCLSLFFFYAGSLLAINGAIYYVAPPFSLQIFSTALVAAGLCFLPPLVLHLHVEYAKTRNLLGAARWKSIVLILVYAPVPYFALRVYALLAVSVHFNFAVPGTSLGKSYGVWLIAALLVSAVWERKFGMSAPRKVEARFHWFAFISLCIASALVYEVHFQNWQYAPMGPEFLETLLALTSILPLGLLIYLVQRHDFLQFGRQKNLVYAVTVTFLALLHLSLVRRVSTWLEPIFPPEASAAILLFVLVVFFEPLQRILGRRLQETAHREMDRVQSLLGEIQHEGRQGNAEQLGRFVEKRVKETFELASVNFSIRGEGGASGVATGESSGFRLSREGAPSVMFLDLKDPIADAKSGNVVGVLRVESHGSFLSGETRAALEFLCEQLHTAIELCRAVEEKAQLERELAERERLALVGQTAASISHNLKNPLGSIKTILQVQLESPELPESMRGETKMVLDEISRLSAKLNQLLQFSRPAVRAGSGISRSDARIAVEEAVSVLRPQAEKRGVSLQVNLPATSVQVAATSEGLNDIASNLLVNALEAVPSGGHVAVSVQSSDHAVTLVFEDDGPGISETLREKILQPFFTTKSQGTGLGLAIVARRVAECGGKLDWESPVKDGKGTRFKVILPTEEVRK